VDESPRPGATVAAFGQVTGSTAIQPNFAHDPPPELLVLILSSAALVVQAQAGGGHPPPTAPTADPVKLIGCGTTHRARPMSQSRVKNYIIISISYGDTGNLACQPSGATAGVRQVAAPRDQRACSAAENGFTADFAGSWNARRQMAPVIERWN